jgi:hypothetical protein
VHGEGAVSTALTTTINAELAEPAEKTGLFCAFCGFCVNVVPV